MRKVGSKLGAVLLSAVMGVSLMGCAGGGSGQGGGALTASDVDVWSTYATEKVLRDIEFTDRGEGKINIEMFRNETEGGQVILTPKKEINAFNATISDLTASDGTVLSKDNIVVYFQKYEEVTQCSKGDDVSEFPHGWYPDALIPMEKAVEYEENTVAAGENQAIYVSVTTPEDQKAGEYNGTLKVTADGVELNVPVTVTVWDWTMPTENHLRTSFGLNYGGGGWGCYNAEELNDTEEMTELYHEFLLNFRINTRFLPTYDIYAPPVDEWIEEAVKAAKDPRVSSFCIPYELDGNNINMNYYDELIVALMTASLKNDINIFEKTFTYFEMFDEANGDPAKMRYATAILPSVKQYAENFADRHRSDFADLPEYSDEKFDEYYETFLNISQLYVGYYGSYIDSTGFTQDKYNYTWVPPLYEYNTVESREYYQNTPEKYERWWYGCMNPLNPQPTYHVDDWGYSPRIFSWEQYKYQIVGNLYWSITYWCDGPTNNQKPIQDLYNKAMQYKDRNGDGYLLYPGKYYGIDGPVASIRLHTIRDGMEDYEAMLALQNKTDALIAEGGLTGSTVDALNPLFDSMFTGTVIHTDSASIYAARREIAKLLTAADLGAVLYDSELSDGKHEFSLFAKDGTTVTATGANEQTVTGGKVYTIVTDATTADEKLAFTVTKGEQTVSVSIAIDSVLDSVTADEFKAALTLADADNTEATVSGNELTLAFTDATKQEFMYRTADIGTVDTSSTVYTMTVTNYSETKFTFYVKAIGTKNTTTSDVVYMTVNPGQTRTIDAQLQLLPWKALGNFGGLIIQISSDAPVTVGISDVTIQK